MESTGSESSFAELLAMVDSPASPSRFVLAQITRAVVEPRIHPRHAPGNGAGGATQGNRAVALGRGPIIREIFHNFPHLRTLHSGAACFGVRL